MLNGGAGISVWVALGTGEGSDTKFIKRGKFNPASEVFIPHEGSSAVHKYCRLVDLVIREPLPPSVQPVNNLSRGEWTTFRRVLVSSALTYSQEIYSFMGDCPPMKTIDVIDKARKRYASS